MKKQRSKADIEAEVRQRVAAEKCAYHWVEHIALVESISEEEMKKMISQITLSHYQDILEERAVSKHCGYPLCSNVLLKISAQKYHISTTANKVYDMTERNYFCSTFCFEASKFIEEQIPLSPVWLRDSSTEQEVNFLSKDTNTPSNIKFSHEISIGMEKIRLEDMGNENADNNTAEWDGVSDDDDSTRSKSCKNNTSKVHGTLLLRDNVENVPPKNAGLEELLSKLRDILVAWCDASTYTYLQRDKRLESRSLKEKNDEKNDFCEKAMRFLSKNPEWVEESKISNKTQDQNKQNLANLPPVDSKAQHTIRRRIVKEKIQSTFRKLSPVFRLTNSQLIEGGFYTFIDTFRFTSKNIILKPKEWLLMTLLLLRIYAYSASLDLFTANIETVNDFLVNEDIREFQPIEDTALLFIKQFLFHDDDDSGDEGGDDDGDLAENGIGNMADYAENILFGEDMLMI